jgi:hypothetical protein
VPDPTPAPTPAAAAAPAGPRMTAPASGVKVRMYRQGLGDCFLLAFPTAGARPCYVLIDCGVLAGTPDAEAKMREVAASLRDATGGEIDVLVATHQHWDHLSGFAQAREVFDQIRIGEVWVAWTEDPDNELGASLRARRDTAVRALWAASRSLRAQGGEGKADALDSVLGFFGDLGMDGRPSSLTAALQSLLGRGHPRYRVPGEPPVALPGVAGVRVYVLGPPQDDALLMRGNPARPSGEVYEKGLALDEETAFYAAALGADAPAPGSSPAPTPAPPAPAPEAGTDLDEEELVELSLPFDRFYQVSPEAAQAGEFFQQHYFGSASGEAGEPPAADMAWRRIDQNWLASADNLSLQLDCDTNNTSLALAIELAPGGRVLLFPGDAQVGNWLSWHDPKLCWPRADDPQHPVTAADLLRRTVLYKVGHHGSHNGTLREKGLELMASPDLVALLPVDEKMAREPKGDNPQGWDLPFPPLLDRLRQKTDGRILRADSGAPAPDDLGRLSEPEKEAFLQSQEVTPLYVEVTVEG